MTNFRLWLEFQVFNPANWNIQNEFCNIHVDLPDGRHYGLNVCTYKYLDGGSHTPSGSGNMRCLFPDLFVKELTRKCIEEAIHDLLAIGHLDDVLNPRRYDNLC